MEEELIMNIIKKDGSETRFNKNNIINAIQKANQRVSVEERFTYEEIKNMALKIESELKAFNTTITTTDVRKLVEDYLIASNRPNIVREYIIFRYQKQLDHKKNSIDDQVLSLLNNTNETINQENANKNPAIVSTMRDYMAGIVSKDLSDRYLIPEDIVKANEEGIIHFHDKDYFAMPIHNCDLVNLEDMLQNGTVVSGTLIERPHKFSTACNIASQIIAQVASSQYGGQTISLAHISPFINESRETFKKRFPGLSVKEIEKMVDIDISDGIQILQYQINTLMTTNGQTPFVSISLYIDECPEQFRDDHCRAIAEVFNQRIKGIKCKDGTWVSPVFPKLLYFLQEDNIEPDSKYYWLTELAAKCSARRMVPDYISTKIMKRDKEDVYPCMGCRSFLTPDPKNHKYWGRFNQGVVTLNLPDVALCSKKDMEKFWLLLNERLELCHRALRLRHEHLRGVKSDVAPILWQYGALARLNPGETIDKLLINNYSTLSLGYAGLYETVRYLTGKNHWEEGEGKELALQIMNKLNDNCDKWKEVEKISYSLYGTPLENTTEKFAKSLQRRHGIVKGITDKNYVTNSYHIPVFQKVNAFDKLTYEAPFSQLSKGGAISYVEVGDLVGNEKAILEITKHIYDNIIYAEINTKLDHCMNCGYDGEITMLQDENGKYIWECPQCHNRDRKSMIIVRRVCGYLMNSNNCPQGRLGDIHDRVLHLDQD